MTYRTLEEKFLADFESLEKERNNLRSRVDELEQLLTKERGNMLLDAMVKSEGRKVVFDRYTKHYGIPKTSLYEYGEWCRRFIDDGYGSEPKPPNGVSAQEFVDYFEPEFSNAFDAQYERENADES